MGAKDRELPSPGAAISAYPASPIVHAGFIAGGGEMGARMRAYDWSSTALGPHDAWPQSLRTAVRIMLTSRYAMWMLWGPDLTFLCNDAYKPTLGVKEEWALGARSDKVWEEIWPAIGPRIAHVLATGEATWDEGLLLLLERRGFPEETYHTFSYSPLTDNADAITGMLCVVTEETERVIGERRLRMLSGLGSRLAAIRTRPAVCDAVDGCLAEMRHDLPFALIYLFDAGGGPARLACSTGVAAGQPAAPERIDPGADSLWPYRDLPVSGMLTIGDLGRRFADLPDAPWGCAPTQAVLVPIGTQGLDRPRGFVALALNPYRPLDAPYRRFIDLFVGQIVAAFASADAYEAERQRAERLAELDRAKTTFFSNISHEFRTPLTLMLSPLEQVLAKPDAAVAADDRALVGVAHRNGLRLLRLVNGLLDFSRVEAGRASARFEQVDLARFTAELAGNFRSLCEQAGLSLDVDCPPLDRPVCVDRDMWEKVVLNLLSNAFKFTFTGGISVVLRRDGDHAVLAVGDTGTGIPASEVPRLFERFHRVEGARGRTFEGSGIGLALVQELVRLHDGAIRVESVVDRGSTFFVSLPFERRDAAAAAVGGPWMVASTAVRAEAFVEEARRWLGDEAAELSVPADLLSEDALGPQSAAAHHGRILLADDNADMREHVRRLLERQGYAVVTATDGQAALEIMRSRPPDLVLTDVMMPHLDGLGLLQAIRADGALRELPVIMLSARSGEEAKVEGLQAGADDYLTKPFSARELLARVNANLQLARVRREAGEALRRANEELENEVAKRTQERDRIWTNSRDLLVVIDADSIVRAVSPAWTRVLGLAPEDAIGRNFLDFVWPEDVERTQAAHAVAVRENLPSFENRYQHADGTFRTISWYTSVEGPLVYAYGRDVTEERQREAELTQTQEALRQAQKMEAVGQLTGGLAHDFNNLLAGISGSLELMQARMSQGRFGELDRYMTAAQGAAKRAAALTHRLLAFSRRQTLDAKPTDVNRLVAGMEDLVRRTVGPSIAMEVVGASGLWPALVDPGQLENALLNLCINARDAMPDGGRMTVETANRWLDARTARDHDMPAGQYIALSVTDSGTGMPPEIIARVFEPFFTTKPIGQGTGLGLSMIYGFVRQSGGQVRIDSEVGRGTTVCIYLPRHFGATQDEDAPPDLVEAPRADRGETVLIVDDEPTVRMLVTEVLEDLGYTAIEATDSAEGLTVLQSDVRLDLLVTDVGLPGGMNGRQMADAGRAVRPGLKVLFITGYAETAVLGHGHLDPGMQVMTKPFAMEALAGRIRDLISNS